MSQYPAIPWRAASVLVPTLTLLLILALGPEPAFCDGAGAPQAPPPMDTGDEGEEPRRDVRMGRVDHMRMGRNEDGDVIMEVEPKPRRKQEAPPIGPIYVMPQVGGGQYVAPGAMPGPGQAARPGQQMGQQPGQQMGGQPGQGMGQRMGPQPGQQPGGQPGMQPGGQPGQGWGGQPAVGQPGQGFLGQPPAGQPGMRPGAP